MARIDPFKNTVTMNIGYLIYATFHIACFTILMSMLIAMMTQSYQNIIVNSYFNYEKLKIELTFSYN